MTMSLSIKSLYLNILDFDGDHVFETVIKKWVLENNYKSTISNISQKILSDKIALSQDDIWELYALNRVLDVLTLQFQTNNHADGSEWLGTKISVLDYIEFNHLIGLETFTPESFDTFDCEIIDVHAGTRDFQIIEQFFPAVKLKNLIIKRAGVKLALNPTLYDLELINQAAIYWTFWRKNRKYFDLSQGWGSNSQWRTDFRLDLETKDHFIYNILGEQDLNTPNSDTFTQLHHDNLEIKEAIELVKFRHFIACPKDDSDLFPYDYKYIESKCT